MSKMMAETAMIPPVARRKLMMREKKRQFENRRNIVLLLIIFLFMLLPYYGMHPKRAANNVINSVEDVGKISFDAPKTDTQLRRGRSWVSQDSQPFVRRTVTFGFRLLKIWLHFLTLSYVVGNHRIKNFKPQKLNI
jgi:hypothetical protein